MATSVSAPERLGPSGPLLLPPRRRGWRSGWTLAIVCVVLVLALCVVVSRSGIFSMASLQVRGERHLSRQDVVALSGLVGTTNVLWLSTSEVEHRLLADPWIRAVEVRRSLPTQISITIHERTAVAVASEIGGPAFLLASDGVVLGPAPAGVALPAIELPGAPALAVGQHLSGVTSLQVVAAFSSDLAKLVATVSLGRQGVDVQMRSGVRVIYGDATDPVAKARALVSVLAWAEEQGIIPAYVDVSAPSAPALLPVTAGVTTPPALPVAVPTPTTPVATPTSTP